MPASTAEGSRVRVPANPSPTMRLVVLDSQFDGGALQIGGLRLEIVQQFPEAAGGFLRRQGVRDVESDVRYGVSMTIPL